MHRMDEADGVEEDAQDGEDGEDQHVAIKIQELPVPARCQISSLDLVSHVLCCEIYLFHPSSCVFLCRFPLLRPNQSPCRDILISTFEVQEPKTKFAETMTHSLAPFGIASLSGCMPRTIRSRESLFARGIFLFHASEAFIQLEEPLKVSE